MTAHPLLDHMDQPDEQDPIAPEGARPNFWRDWALVMLLVAMVTGISGETDSSRPVAALLLGVSAVLTTVALLRRASWMLRR